MATIYITEYKNLGYVGGGLGQLAQAPVEPAIADQSITITGASAQSSAFNASTTLIRVHTDATCSIKIGINPTAVTTAHRMAANETDYYAVIPGQLLAVITNS